MKRPGIGTLLSIAVNFFLFFWLVQQYFSDLYFQTYVNTVFIPIYPFIVLTLGVGGGSGLGYFLLKRRHTPDILGTRIIKPRPFRPISTIASPSSQSTSSASFSAKNMPTGTPPSIASKHTAYSVPSLAKAPSPNTTRPAPSSSSWSIGSKSSTSPILRQDTGVKTPPSNPRGEEPRTGFNPLSSVPRPDAPITPSGSRFSPEPAPRPGAASNWRSQDAIGSPERRSETSSLFQRPGLDTNVRPATSTTGPAQPLGSSQGQASSQSAVPPTAKWQPSEQKSTPNQWTAPQRTDSPPPVPSKWISPQGSPNPQSQSQPQSPQSSTGVPPRTGTPYPPRPGFPQSQPPPRPFVYQGPRPGDPRPTGAPRPFGPDQNRPPGGFGPGPRPPSQQFQRPPPPTSSTVGPMPQPWRPQGPPTTTSSDSQPSQNSQSGANPSEHPSKTSSEQNIPQGTDQSSATPGSEMDWDTALDTILKTLRKDRGTDKA